MLARAGPPAHPEQVASFGVVRPRRDHYDDADPQTVLGRLLLGFDEDRTAQWVTFDPDAVLAVRRDVVRAIDTAARSSDEYAEWFASQLRIADDVLEHAARHREWVVSLFEGDYACFRCGFLRRR